MVNFVVVNSFQEEFLRMQKLLEENLKRKFQIKVFKNYSLELKEEIKDIETKKIYILDLKQDKDSFGIKIAKYIREIDPDSEIVFLVEDERLVSKYPLVYDLLRFVVKNQEFEVRFVEMILDIVNKYFDDKMFVYKESGRELSIYYKSIMYIYREKKERQLVIVTDSKNNNTHVVKMSLKTILSYLDKRFCYSHRSCIVNKERIVVKNYKEKYFIASNGDKRYLLSKNFRCELEC